jgi:hypothetical protein
VPAGRHKARAISTQPCRACRSISAMRWRRLVAVLTGLFVAQHWNPAQASGSGFTPSARSGRDFGTSGRPWLAFPGRSPWQGLPPDAPAGLLRVRWRRFVVAAVGRPVAARTARAKMAIYLTGSGDGTAPRQAVASGSQRPGATEISHVATYCSPGPAGYTDDLPARGPATYPRAGGRASGGFHPSRSPAEIADCYATTGSANRFMQSCRCPK